MTKLVSPLQGKRIILGVSGGISCYKSADLVRKLIEAEADVRVVMTAGAQEFVTPLTFQALSGNPVHTTLLDPSAEAAMGHIELARWADAIVIAPASANTLARLAHGLADDLLATICLATEAPLAIAPAMNRVMWSNPATQANLDILQSRGTHVIGPGSGDQACGEVGAGRMLEPLEIRDALSTMLKWALRSRPLRDSSVHKSRWWLVPCIYRHPMALYAKMLDQQRICWKLFWPMLPSAISLLQLQQWLITASPM